MKINTNYRSVQALTNEQGDRRFWNPKAPLCDGCGKADTCATLKSKKRLEKKSGATLSVSECAAFMYCLVFQDPKGTGAPRFNTIRLGKAWSARVRPGDHVALVNKAGQVYGIVEVEDTETWDKESIVYNNAWMNHLYIGTGMDLEQAGLDLLRRMPGIYGNLIYKNNKEATVIRLRQV